MVDDGASNKTENFDVTTLVPKRFVLDLFEESMGKYKNGIQQIKIMGCLFVCLFVCGNMR